MKNLTYIFTIALILCSFSTKAQDFINANDYNFGPEHFNTSYIAEDSSSLKISTIVSAVNAAQNNSKFHFLMYGSVGTTGLGVGAKVNTTFYRLFQTTTAEFMLAKKIDVGKENAFSFGLNGGIAVNSLKTDRINEYTDLNDPVLVGQTFNKVGFIAGLGMNYNWKDRIDLGVSVPILIQSVEGVAPVYFTSFGYTQKIGSNFSIKPNVMLYGPNYINSSFEGSVKFDYDNKLWIKGGGRTTKKLLFGAGGSLNFVDIGYMYNMALGNGFADVYSGAHNINVVFNFLAEKPFQVRQRKDEDEVVVMK